MNRVSDGDRSTSLSFLSCGALQSDEVIGILKVLFRYFRDRHAVGDVQRQLDGGAGVRDPGARPDRFCAVAGRAFVTSVNTHPRGLPLRGFLSHHGTKTTWAMAFPRINCRTTTATVLTATATVTLSLRACLFLCYTPITSPSAADFFYFLKPPACGRSRRTSSVKSTSPDTENHNKNGYANYMTTRTSP